MELPRYDVVEAGLDWVLSPSDCQTAAAYQWEAYLAFLISWRHALLVAFDQACRDEVSPKAVEVLLRQTRDSVSAVQSLLRSMQHG